MTKLPPLSVFVSYSQKDEKRRAKMVDGLGGLVTAGWITSPWYDRNIRAGQEWDPEIMARLRQSDLILLMVTDNFMGSDYCMKEVDIALERHQMGSARVVPVIVERANWQIGRFSKLQALPKSGNPVFRGNYLDKDLRVEVAQGILEEITAFCSNSNGAVTRSSNALDPNQTVLAQLCNRVDQDRQLRDAWQQHFQSLQLRRRPFVCVVHGSVQEDHAGYRKRLTAYSLPQAMELRETEIRNPLPVKWPDPPGEQSTGPPAMLSALSKALNCPPQIPVCSDNLYRLGEACVVYYELFSSARGYGDQATLASLFDFWAAWPDLPVQQKLVVIVFVQYSLGFPINFARSDTDIVTSATRDGRVSAVILKELPLVTSQHVKDWIRRPEIERYCDVENKATAWEAEIDAIFRDHAEIPMEQLTGSLNRMLYDYRRRAV